MRFGFSFRYAPTAKTVKNRKTPKVVTDSLPFVTAFVTNFLSFSYFLAVSYSTHMPLPPISPSLSAGGGSSTKKILFREPPP
ncbi:hypothetical protein COH79_06420, partial [Neisseria meningitidis]